MVFLGFGKYVRADRIYALEPIVGDERGNGRRTLVWVEGMSEAMVASRTEESILDEMGADSTAAAGRPHRRRADQPQLFADGTLHRPRCSTGAFTTLRVACSVQRC